MPVHLHVRILYSITVAGAVSDSLRIEALVTNFP